MGTKNQELHIAFFPFMAQGHIIPFMDLAKLFVSRGLKATIITTSPDAPSIQTKLQNYSSSQIQIFTIKVPTADVGLPENCQSLHCATTPEMHLQFLTATGLLGPQIQQFFQRKKPNCLVADMFFPWATDLGSEFGIPVLLFQGIGYFPLCAILCVHLYKPHLYVSSDSDPFVIPNLPGAIELTRKKLPDFVTNGEENVFTKLLGEGVKAQKQSYGVLVNSFYELEAAYADHYRNDLGIRAWHVGPLYLANERLVEENKSSIEEQHECIKWLDLKKPSSVIYVCFGSLATFVDAQLLEIAEGLEASEQNFIWVVKKQVGEDGWLPEGFEKRVEGRGLVVRGWAPQVKILSHAAVGGFVTHCGWNSTLEAVAAGVPMVTWPIFAEQFYNEKLITQVLGIGVCVGAKEWMRVVRESVRRDEIEKAVRRAMVGEEAEEIRTRARVYGELARRAVEVMGSSSEDLDALIHELLSYDIAQEL
ncbi:hypothetical protein D8674_026420 [Pyrus ussuriensis x Pyrus communis]|uniref:Glycosyltransferase n=1 Tax=Pyrus ussuriensis x Pyrus communis TaxID=2448454 RepID=A0A5N5I6V5_9ROSA|nr:hypothetical protein D8674_026420 [Pyrus ussuriensis x Pyrus communis]